MLIVKVKWDRTSEVLREVSGTYNDSEKEQSINLCELKRKIKIVVQYWEW